MPLPAFIGFSLGPTKSPRSAFFSGKLCDDSVVVCLVWCVHFDISFEDPMLTGQMEYIGVESLRERF